MRHSVESQYDSWNFVYPSLGRGSFQQAGAEHVVHRLVAPFVDCVALGVVWRSEDLLDPERAQELGPNGADELSALIGEKSSEGAKVGDHMPHEGLTDCACGVVTRGNEDGVF